MLLGIAIYLLYINWPSDPLYEEFLLNKTQGAGSGEIQFYANMRYMDRKISYTLSNSCDAGKKLDAERAFSIISEKTILEFNRVSTGGEIEVLCSDVGPEPEEKGHFVAGEGGPSEIINTSMFAVIFSGKVSLFRKNECMDPNVAIHEILHALGFDHNNNGDSIMYPVTKCEQQIDNYIIDEINRIYKIDSVPDLVIEKITARKVGRYLSFEIDTANFGLHNSNGSVLDIYVGSELVREFDLGDIEVGLRKILTVENLKVPQDAEVLLFEIKTSEDEIDKENNKVVMKLEKIQESEV